MTAPTDVAPPETARRSATALWTFAALALAVSGVVIAFIVGAGTPRTSPSGFPEASLLVQWALPSARAIIDLLAATTVGLLLAAAALLPSSKDLLAPAPARAARLASWLAWVWALLALVVVVLSYAETFATTVTDSLGLPKLLSFVSQSNQGSAWLVAASLAAFAGVVAREADRPLGAWVALLLALGATLPPAVTGHAASAGNHDLATSSLVVHIMGVSLWVGGLLALVWYARTDGRFLPLAVRRFSPLAFWAFVGVGVSGAVNALIRLGDIDVLFTTQYGAVVLIKVMAFVALGLLGWAHRRHALPQLDAGAPHAFARLAAVEAAIMVFTIGVGVGLAATAPPASDATEAPPPAEVLLGFPLPDAPSVLAILTGWRLDLLVLAVLLAAGALYGRGLLRMHRRGDRWPVGRTIAWYAGLAFVAFGTLSGLAAYGRTSFSLHMTQHMTLSMIAPLLLVLAAPITLALRALPAAGSKQPAGAREWLLAALHSPFGRVLTHPVTAFVLFITAPYVIYFSGIFELAMRDHWAHQLMYVHFVLVGFLFYESLIGLDPVPYRASHPMRMVAIFASLAFHAFFAVALMSGDAVIAATFYETLDRDWWPDLLEDQTSGASFAWAFGELPGILVLVVLLFQWSREDDRRARREDRQADRDNNAELAAYNQMLQDRRDTPPA
ncbi:MAG: bifunctional copper resistance protein CopD/cytochrome c oxidase assembly protein [Actinomycetia bacterium]|nr:bifunctional copper resistance protein CopD/cytochrome c oxidase assembly protein [Actinomycetes bacterium]